MAGIWKKMRSENGESLTELLLSVLIVSLGLSMFATALLSSKKMLELGEAKANSYYTGTGRAPDRWLSFHQWAGDQRTGGRWTFW